MLRFAVKVQVRSVLLTLASPSTVVPLKSFRLSPSLSAALRVPLRLGVGSSSIAAAMTPLVPVLLPALSSIAVIVAVVLGAVMSRFSTKADDSGPLKPLASMTRAV